MIDKSVESRFWSKVEISDRDTCWNWTGAVDTPGYGAFKIDGKKVSSHVVAFMLTYGEIPVGKEVCHVCAGNKLCCNPRHLYAGTRRDNVMDALLAGTFFRIDRCEKKARGEMSGRAKLSNSNVIKIREMLSSGIPQRKIAELFGVSQKTISRINTRENWSTLIP